MDISVEIGTERFNFRVAGVLINEIECFYIDKKMIAIGRFLEEGFP